MKTNKILYVFIIVMLAASFGLSPVAGKSFTYLGNIINVDVHATGANNGTSWEDAFTDLQPALELAVSGDQVWVAAGTYLPTEEHCGSGDRYKSFQLKNGVALYGGFDPTIGDVGWDDRDWEQNMVNLSGDLGVIGDSSDNSYHVFCHPEGLNLDSTAILDGFTITGGNADSETGPDNLGGGMYNYTSSPALFNVTFSYNFAAYGSGGGGMYNYSSSPILTNVIFTNNSYYGYGGGGGILNETSSPTLTNVTISNNSANIGSGGGIYNNLSSSPTLINVTIANNSANYGGGMNNSDSSPTMTNVTIDSNYAYSFGGGMYNSNSSPTLINIKIANNYAWGGGGGMNNNNSSPTLTNVTISNNGTYYEGGGMSNGGSSTPQLTNCIVWGNQTPQIAGAPAIISYSDIQGGYEGTGNIDADPLFIDATAGNFRLQQYSPAIDAGDNSAVPPDVTVDMDGNLRFIDDPLVADTGNGTPPIVDMGPYEHSDIVYEGVIYVDADASGNNNGTSWEDAFTSLQSALEDALSGDQIWVAAGTYYPTVEYCARGDNRYKSFQLKNGVEIYSGFDPSTGDVGWDDRDWVANPTILSGDIGLAGNNSDNSYHVFCHPDGLGLDSSAILDGFTITSGNANHVSDWTFQVGGGMFNSGSSPMLNNLMFINNNAVDGGGIFNNVSAPILNAVNFFENIATGSGGGMNNSLSSPNLTNVTFSNNTAYHGGGMQNSGSSPTLTNVTFSGNAATQDWIFAAHGGGMHNSDNSSPLLINVTFYGNTSTGYGGGMSNESSSPMLINITFNNNSGNGGAMFNEFSSPTLTNSILWGDSGEIYNSYSSNPIIIFSDVQGGYEGTGNINVNPALGPLQDNGGYVFTVALGAGSPAVDAGNPDPATCPAMDARGESRPFDGDGDGVPQCDMGTYESQSVPLKVFLPIVWK
jgi:hypothetical protein